MTDAAPLRILHALRTPVGGIFRHVIDLAAGQAERGHDVGILTDSLTGGARADAQLAELAPRMRLGIHRMPIHRAPHPSDLLTWLRFNRLARQLAPQVLHGHGAKTGVFVRLPAAAPGRIRVYTPHGGSVHFGPHTLEGMIYMGLERALMARTDLFLFESAFARDTLLKRIGGTPQGLVRTVFNGVTAGEFDPVLPAPDATDIAYVGEFRPIKGADLLIDAVARLHADGRPVTVTLGGDGEQMEALKAQVERLGLQRAVRFIGHVKARHGFAQGRLLVVPSRGDSMPYVVIEAGAAGVPMVASDVGGIPEIFGPFRESLFANGSVGAMADAIESALADLDGARQRAKALRERIFLQFSQKAMVDGIIAAYREAFARR
jgi:glycosyltransferase involved in cell wall biosynthesis